MKSYHHITQQELLDRYEYDPVTGDLWSKNSKRTGVNKKLIPASFVLNQLRWIPSNVRVRGYQIKITHVIYKMMTGEWPDNSMDHKNGDPTDNRWKNLRPASPPQNMWNAKRCTYKRDLPTGVYQQYRTYQAYISANKKRYYSRFVNREEAIAWRKAMEEKLHGEYAYSKRPPEDDPIDVLKLLGIEAKPKPTPSPFIRRI
jgi:HNH endonuclease